MMNSYEIEKNEASSRLYGILMMCLDLLSLTLVEKVFRISECVLKGHGISQRAIADVQTFKYLTNLDN